MVGGTGGEGGATCNVGGCGGGEGEPPAPSKVVFVGESVNKCSWDSAEERRGELAEAPFDFVVVCEEHDFPKIIPHKCFAESPYDVNMVDVAKTPPEEISWCMNGAHS